MSTIYVQLLINEIGASIRAEWARTKFPEHVSYEVSRETRAECTAESHVGKLEEKT